MKEPALAPSIDKLCDQFERELRSGNSATIEDYLGHVASPERATALYWLLKIESAVLAQRTTKVDANDYLARFPQYTKIIAKVFGSSNQPREDRPSIPGNQIVELISQGGQGAVFRAIQERTGQEVALKFIATEHLRSTDCSAAQRAIDNFETEVKTAATFRHPNAISLYDAGQCDSGTYLVMELVPGGNLDERRSKLNQYKVAKIIRRIAEVVAEAHRSRILHLDIKPQNILYDESVKQPRLIDFGLARLEAIGQRADVVAGTPGYMPPEQASHEKLDERTDVFGLGATLNDLLTGQRPVPGDNAPLIQADNCRNRARVGRPVSLAERR